MLITTLLLVLDINESIITGSVFIFHADDVLKAEGNSSSAADDSGSTAVATTSSAVNDSSSPGLAAGSSTVPSTTMASQPARLRFPRFLRRTHSASASPDAPPYALFLRTKRVSTYCIV